MKVGFIGLGTMGRHMARHLQEAGYPLVVNDIRREAVARHIEAGAEWADSPIRVAEASDVVFTSLPGPVEMEAVALGADGLIHGMRPGTVYFDLTTNSPALERRVHAATRSTRAASMRASASIRPQEKSPTRRRSLPAIASRLV